MTILIDTNLLVLLVIGSVSRAYIGRHKRTRAYTVGDFDLLVAKLSAASAVRTTPHVLAEVSNLVRQFAEPGRSAVSVALQHSILVYPELAVSSVDAATHPDFVRLGLTDAGILTAQGDEGRPVLLTDDLDLYLTSVSAGLDAVNFAHLRDAA